VFLLPSQTTMSILATLSVVSAGRSIRQLSMSTTSGYRTPDDLTRWMHPHLRMRINM
jgi:hypothetical protein